MPVDIFSYLNFVNETALFFTFNNKFITDYPIIKNNWGQLLLLFLPPANLTCLIRQLLHNISHSDITLFAKNIIWSVIFPQKIEKTQKLTQFIIFITNILLQFLLFCFMENILFKYFFPCCALFTCTERTQSL